MIFPTVYKTTIFTSDELLELRYLKLAIIGFLKNDIKITSSVDIKINKIFQDFIKNIKLVNKVIFLSFFKKPIIANFKYLNSKSSSEVKIVVLYTVGKIIFTFHFEDEADLFINKFSITTIKKSKKVIEELNNVNLESKFKNLDLPLVDNFFFEFFKIK